MQILVFMFLISLATCLPVVEEGNLLSRTAVYVREVEVEGPRHRTTRQAAISRQKRFNFNLISQTVELDLELNSLIRDDVNVYVTENNVTRLVEIIKHNEEQYGYYQDIKTKASVMVTCNKVKCIPVGTFSVNGRRYQLEPNNNITESTHFVTEIHPRPDYTSMKGNNRTIFDYIIPEDGSKLIDGAPINEPHISDKGGDATNTRGSRIRGEILADVDIVELYLYTDEAIFDRFRKLYTNLNTTLEMTRQYYLLVCNEMDLEYQQVKNASSEGIDIRIYCKGIHVALDSTGAPWSSNTEDPSGHVHASNALKEFSVWQRNFKHSNNLTYDHAMAMSGKIFIGGTAGIAYLDTVCYSNDVFKASLIEDTPYRLVLVAIHELGHFLSAYHDPFIGECSQDFVMSWTINTVDYTRARNQHTFSSCSIGYFTSKLVSLGVNRCTRQHSFTDQEYNAYISKPISGEQLSLDQQCQVYFGVESYACYKRRDMCHRGIYCRSSTGCNRRLYLVMDHSPCQEPSNKWCFRGLCVEKPTTPRTRRGSQQVYQAGIPSTTTAGIPSTTTAGIPSTTTAGIPSTTTAGIPSTTTAGIPSTTTAGIPSTTTAGIPSTTTAGIPSTTTAGIPSTTTAGIPSTTTAGIPSTTETTTERQPFTTVINTAIPPTSIASTTTKLLATTPRQAGTSTYTTKMPTTTITYTTERPATTTTYTTKTPTTTTIYTTERSNGSPPSSTKSRSTVSEQAASWTSSSTTSLPATTTASAQTTSATDRLQSSTSTTSQVTTIITGTGPPITSLRS